jgi:TonB-linked SusC/RagA family outer membrane protein
MKINEIFEECGSSVASRQIWRIMKLTTIIMTIFLLQVSAASVAQITLKTKQESLQKVLKNISRQSGYDFIYADQDLSGLRVNNINLNNVSIEKALQECLAGQPVDYEIADKTVMVQRRQDKGVLDRLKDYFSAIDIRGKVVDENGQPLVGANVSVKTGGKSTITDSKGEFILNNVNEGTILLISFIGYQNVEVKASSGFLTTKLEISNSKLDEVQVIAYGITSRRLSTGNVSTVKAEDLGKSTVSNPLLALQGMAPGIFIEQSSGYANSGVKVTIQGPNSLGKGNDPLYVIDGIPYTSQLLPSLANLLGSSNNNPSNVSPTPSGSGNPLSFISPSDIESIDVLKDGEATAIYGSRAANGAILITTKKARMGKTSLDLNLQQGVGEIGRKLNLLTTDQYLEIRNEAFKNDNIAPSAKPGDSGYAKDLKVWDTNKYTDWQEELIGGLSSYTDIQTSINGGSELTQFLISGNYKRQSSVFPGESVDQKGALHFSLNNSLLNQRFKLTLTGNYIADYNNLFSTDLTDQAVKLSPDAPSLYNSDGTLNFQPLSNGASSFTNPLASLNNKLKIETKNLLLSADLNYKVSQDINLKSSFGYNDLQTSEVGYTSSLSQLPENRKSFGGVGRYGQGNSNTWIIEPQITFKRKFPIGEFEFLIGSTLQQTFKKSQILLGSGYSSDLVLQDLNSAATVSRSTAVNLEYKYSAIFSRLNYNLQNKYLANITIRRDGSSRFGKENQFHNFLSLSTAWIFSNEKWLVNETGIFSFGKIKASYGTTGNDQIGDYQYLNLYTAIPGIGRAYQGITSFETLSLPNPYLQWEETRKFNIGLDLAFLKDRFFFSGNYYRNNYCSTNYLGQLDTLEY